MPQDRPPPGPITLLHVLPLYYVAVMWGVGQTTTRERDLRNASLRVERF